MPTIAILDKVGRLTGYKTKKKLTADDIEVPEDCDLPVDGTYCWVATSEAFFPIGRGHGKPKRPPVSDERVLYLMAKKLKNDMPQEVKDWVAWYEQNIMRSER